LTDAAPGRPGTPTAAGVGVPRITVATDCTITGTGFLSAHHVTIRVTYTAEDVADYFTYVAGPGGDVHGRLPTSPTEGKIQIAATDHRSDPDGACGLLWSNTVTLTHPSLR
jgi:hypothetical protein